MIERYGMTETFMNVSNPYDAERRPGSVGLVLPGVESRLADNGEICVRGPNVLRSYWERPDATAEAFRDGWFLTGDIGEFDDDGYLRIVGRSKDLIITGGYNVYPARSRRSSPSIPRWPRPRWRASHPTSGARRWSPTWWQPSR